MQFRTIGLTDYRQAFDDDFAVTLFSKRQSLRLHRYSLIRQSIMGDKGLKSRAVGVTASSGQRFRLLQLIGQVVIIS